MRQGGLVRPDLKFSNQLTSLSELPGKSLAVERPSDQRSASVIGKNTFFTFLSLAVQVGTRFILIPVVIYHLGLGGYGIWSIIMATAGYMRFGSAGLNSAFQKYVAEATSNGDYETAKKLLSTGSLCMLGFSLVCLIPLAFSAPALATASGVPRDFLPAATSSIMLLAIIMIVSNFGAAFEAIVMGGHRIDLTRKFRIVTTVGEAVGIVAVLHFGFGIFAMTVVMALSTVIYLLLCLAASRRVVPEILLSVRSFTPALLGELTRFAFSYQAVNILEVLYGVLVPVIILKYFGAGASGVYAVVSRLVTAALIGQEALILPLLSSGTVMFASAAEERVRHFLAKSFKTAFAVTLLPLAFIAAFGGLMILAWTGQDGPDFGVVILLSCIANFFSALSRVQLILYRASGRALHDNIRQIFRLVALVVLTMLGGRLGFRGVLVGLAFAELFGVIYLFFAMTSALKAFRPRLLIPDGIRLATAVAVMIFAGLLAQMTPAPPGIGERSEAGLKLVEVAIGCSVVFWPAITATKSVSSEERSALIYMLDSWIGKTRRRAPNPCTQGEAGSLGVEDKRIL